MGDELAAFGTWASIFKNPSELVKTVTKHYALHHKAIQTDIAALEADWDAGLFFKSGVDLADLLTLGIGPIVVTEEVVNLPPVNLVPDFTAGLIYGFTGNNHLDDLQGCMEDISPLEEDAENFISHLTHGKIIEAIQDVGDVIWMLPDAVEGCDNADVNEDIQAIEEWATIFT